MLKTVDKNQPLEKTKKSEIHPRRFIPGLIILALVLIGFGIFGYIRFLVPYQIKHYVNQTISDYNHLQDQFNQAGQSFDRIEVLESKKLNQFTNDIDTALTICNDNQTKESERYVPRQCKELHQKLTEYYDDAGEALNETKAVVDYFGKLGEIVKDLEDATITSNSQNLNEVLKEFRKSEKKLATVVQEMKAVKAPQDLHKLHQDLTSFIKELKNFTTDVKNALIAKEYDEVKTLTNQMENEQKNYSSKIDKDFKQFKEEGQVGNFSTELESQGKEIDRLVSDLKSHYHF